MTTILIADDLEENRYLLTSLLEGHGYRVVAARNGAEALTLALGSPPDLVITDVLMPVMDGFELCRRWKRDERLRRVPFVVYTATYTDPEDERLALGLGADRFLTKPQAVEALLRVVREVLDEAGRDPGALRSGPSGDEKDLLRRHNETLVRKLEKRVAQLEAEVARRNEVEAALRASNELWQSTFDAMLDPVALLAPDGRVERANRAMGKHFGREPRDLEGQACHRLFHQADGFVEGCPVVASRSSGKRETMELVVGDRTFFVMADPRVAADGRIEGFVHVVRDVTEQKRSEASLQESERRFRLLAESSLDVVWSMGFDGRFTYVSPSVERLRGYTPEEVMDHSLEDVLLPKGLKRFHEEMAPVLADLAAGRAPYRSGVFELEQPCKDGSTVWTEVVASVMRDETGRAVGLQGVSRNITERKQADLERQRLQGQLLQSQKMESIGRLAGGVAHDFNNLLSVILSHVGFAIDDLPEDHPVRADLVEVRRAGERAAALTRQLLAFSRKQVLQPVPLSLNQVAAGVEKMLRRILGEDIELVQVLAPDLGLTLADPGQIEQVLLNLVVNARDAMAEGGRLTIETSNVELDRKHAAGHATVEPGSYVQLAVTDGGCGMDEETRARIFEPFFTTKEQSKGTGLGLSTVYGIVSQSGGTISVSSEPGKGTRFEIYLPRAPSTARVPAIGTSTPPARTTGTETILLVEDEEALRRVAVRALGAAGYTVLTAADGEEALAAAARHEGDIHLLLTDVIMPRMGGGVLARELAKTRPSLAVVYMSGYTDDAIAHLGTLEEGVGFLAKPFTSDELRRKVRGALDAAAADRAGGRGATR